MKATDHRAVVLESVATCPEACTMDHIVRDSTGPDFIPRNILTMVYQLAKEGLLARREDRSFFITTLGLAWLTHGCFDRALPAHHTRRKRSPIKHGEDHA